MSAAAARIILLLGLAWEQPGLANNNTTIDVDVCRVPQLLIDMTKHGGHWANNFQYFSPHEQYIPPGSSRTTAKLNNFTWIPGVVNNISHRNFTYTFYGTYDCIDSWGPNDTLRYGQNVSKGTSCTINPLLGYSCRSPGMCREPSWNEYGRKTNCTEGFMEEIQERCEDVTTCTDIKTCLGYTTTNYGNCSNASNCANVTDFFDNCTTTEFCETTSVCTNITNMTHHQNCTHTDYETKYTNATSFEQEWACKALCWNNQSDYGIANWTHESCIIGFQGDGEFSPAGMSGGEPLVLEGQYCGIIPQPMYSCTDPGLCNSSGVFETEGFCKALCPVPKMSFGLEKWSDGCEVGGVVEEGTTCMAMAMEGYVCSSPGMCLPYGVWENSDVRCVVAAGIRIQGLSWLSYETAMSDTKVIEYELGNLTVAYGEEHLLTTACLDNNTASLCTGWATDGNNDGVTDCYESQDVIYNIPVLGYTSSYMNFVRSMCPVTCGSCLKFSSEHVDVHVHNETRKSWYGIPTYRRLHSNEFDTFIAPTKSFRPSYHNQELLPLMGATIAVQSPREGIDVRPMMWALVKDTEFLETFVEGIMKYSQIRQLAPDGIEATWYSLTDVEAKDCVGTWGRWKACDSTCGEGVKKRSYKIIKYEYLDGLKCQAKEDTAKCWSGPCPTPSPPTPAPPIFAVKTPAPTSECMSLTGKSDRQCARKCDSVADGCPLTCRMCNTNCECTSIAIQEKMEAKVAKREGKLDEKELKRAAHLAGEEYEAPTVPPTPASTNMPCMLSDDCARSSFCWYGECGDTRDTKVCEKFYGATTDDGWTWDQLATHSNFKCESDDDYDHMASRPKAKKNLKPEHLAWAGQRVDQEKKSTRGALTQWYQKYAVMPKQSKAVKKYQDRDEKEFFQPGGAKHADGFKYPDEHRNYQWDSGKRRLNTEVADGALSKSISACVVLALLFFFFA